MSFIIRNKTGSAISITDLGLTIPLGTVGTPTDFDLSTEQPNDIANSVDLVSAITTAAGSLIILDPRDDTSEMSVADSVLAVQLHNDTHWGIQGGRFGTLDDPATGVTDGDIVRWNAATGEFIACTPASFGPIVGSQGIDGVDTTYVYSGTTALHDAQDETFYDGTNNNGTFVGGTGGTYLTSDVITMSDGSTIFVDLAVAGVVTQFTVTATGATGVTAGVPLTQAAVAPDTGQTGFTVTPEANNIATGTIQWDVDDVFLRNTGDTLDSGTLTIASGATVDFAAGSSLTIDAAVTTATITTPGGGFSNPTDIINKGYVDALLQGIDWKESVRRATTPTEGDLGGAFVNSGGVGDTITYDSTLATGVTMDGWEYTGVPATGLVIGDRVLVKDQTPATENGIYVVTAGSTPTATILTRATDQDGSPSNEVSGGNTTFVETGIVNEKTLWTVLWDGVISMNTDPMNWIQTGAATDVLANEGLNSVANRFNLDISTLTQTVTITTADILAFQDVAGSSGTDTSTSKTTVANFISDLSIVTTPGGNGILVNNGGTIQTVSIAVNGAGPLDGLAVANADGTAGNPTVGLDIQSLPNRVAVDAVNDRVAVWDSSLNTNVYYSIQDISGAVASTNSYGTWARTGNGSGGPIGPNSSADTITLIGGIGISLAMTSTPDDVTFTFSRDGMADTVVVAAQDSIAFFDGSNANEPEYRGFDDLLNDLNIVNSISPNGIVVQTAADTYEGKAVAASALEDADGLSVTNGDGTAGGNIIVGLDIDGMTPSAEDMAATDEFPMHNKSQGTGGANRTMTGTEIANGVSNILNINTLTIASIDGQQVLVIQDTSRSGSPQLSVSDSAITWSEAFISDNDWISIGNAVDALTGYIVPHKARIVKITAHTEDDNNISKAFDLYVDGVGQSLFAFTAVNGENEYQQVTTDIAVAKDTKLRVRATSSPSGSIGDLVITLWLKWEA